MVNTVAELQQAIEDKKYEIPTLKRRKGYAKGHVIDEEKSVRWNRLEVERYNTALTAERLDHRRMSRELDNQYAQDIITAYANDYDLKEEQVGLIYNKVYMDFHSSGMHEVIQELEEWVDIVGKINKL